MLEELNKFDDQENERRMAKFLESCSGDTVLLHDPDEDEEDEEEWDEEEDDVMGDEEDDDDLDE